MIDFLFDPNKQDFCFVIEIQAFYKNAVGVFHSSITLPHEPLYNVDMK